MFRPAKFLSALAISLVLAVFAQAADQPQIPQQKIVGADEPVPAGEIVVLQPSSIDQPPAGLLSVSYGWVIVEDGKVKKRVKAEADGSIIFGAGLTARKFLVILSIDYVFEKAPAAKAGDHPQVIQVHRLVTADVSVTGGQPAPGPNPPPGPGPGPQPLPDGKYKLAATANQLVLTKVTLPAAQRAAAAQAMAQSMRSIVAAINAGQLTAPADILKQTKAANNAALKQAGVEPSAFDAYALELKRVLTQLNAQKLLSTASDFAQAWGEIADGLAAVK